MVKMAGCDSGKIMENKLSSPVTQRDFSQIFRAMEVGSIAEWALFCVSGMVVLGFFLKNTFR